MPTLHLLNKPPGHPRFALCQAQLNEGDSLVLLEDAVFGFDRPELERSISRLFVLRADAVARGLTSDSGSTKARKLAELQCDMAEVVELAVTHSRTVTW